MGIRSGDVLRIAPGADNPGGFVSVHLIHPYFKRYTGFGSVEMTYKAEEETGLNGNLRLYPIGLAKASWEFQLLCRPALDAFLDLIDFDIETDLDKPITVRTWTGFNFVNKSGLIQFLPPENIVSNPWEIEAVHFDFYDLGEIP